MTIRTRKKNSRQRGTHTHGWGSKKKHRGAGSRGGRGRAGSGKKADTNKPTFINQGYKSGKHGFKKKNVKVIIKACGLKYIQSNIDSLIAKKLAEKKGDVFVIELKKLGYNKLLSGNIDIKLNITTDFASKSAIEKVKAAGGEVILPKPKEEAKPAPKAPAEAKKASEEKQKPSEPAAKPKPEETAEPKQNPE